MRIEFVKSAVGYLRRGDGVRITLRGASAEVFLADDTNVWRLERGDLAGFRGYGGTATRSPIMLGVPSAGRWNAVVIPINGRVEVTGVSVLRAAA